METRKLKVTKLTIIKEGTTQKDGKTFNWKLQEVEATKEDGSPIEGKLKTFAELPLNELIEVEVEKQDHPDYGISFMLKKKSNNISRDELVELVKRIDDIEEAIKALEPDDSMKSAEEKVAAKMEENKEETDLDSIPF